MSSSVLACLVYEHSRHHPPFWILIELANHTCPLLHSHVYKCQFLYHGFGPISFYISDGSRWALVHRISYANNNTVPHVANPTLPLHAKVINSGNTTNIVLRTASLGAYTEGKDATGVPPIIGIVGSKGNSKTISSTETNIITYKTKTTNIYMAGPIPVRFESVYKMSLWQ